MAQATFTESQFVVVTVEPVDRKGNTAEVTDVVASSSDTAVVTVAPGEGLSFTVTGVAAGTAQVSFTARNSSGEEISETLDVEVTEELAVELRLSVGEPQDQA